MQTPAQLKPDRNYDILVAVNGTTVTVVVDNATAFTHVFAPRMIGEDAFGLNTGLVGVGSDNARGRFDNVAVQILPPKFSFVYNENFVDGSADLFDGAWSISPANRYESGSLGSGAEALSLVDLGTDLEPLSILELSAVLATDSSAGLVFDHYSGNDYKFVMLDVENDLILIGHRDSKRGMVTDSAIVQDLEAGVDYELEIGLKGASLSVRLDGQEVGGYAFNSALVDGGFGLLAHGGEASVNEVTVKSNDPSPLLQQLQPEIGPVSYEFIWSGSESSQSSSSNQIVFEELDATATTKITRGVWEVRASAVVRYYGTDGVLPQLETELISATGTLDLARLDAIPLGDANYDGSVDGADLAAVSDDQGLTGSQAAPGTDVDGDGDIDQADLAIVQTILDGGEAVNPIGVQRYVLRTLGTYEAGTHVLDVGIDNGQGQRVRRLFDLTVSSPPGNQLPAASFEFQGDSSQGAGIDRLGVKFSGDVPDLDLDSVRLVRDNTSEVSASLFSYQQNSLSAVWGFGSILSAGEYRLEIDLDGDGEVDDVFQFVILADGTPS